MQLSLTLSTFATIFIKLAIGHPLLDIDLSFTHSVTLVTNGLSIANSRP